MNFIFLTVLLSDIILLKFDFYGLLFLSEFSLLLLAVASCLDIKTPPGMILSFTTDSVDFKRFPEVIVRYLYKLVLLGELKSEIFSS